MTKKNLFKHSRFSKSKLAIAMHMLFFGDAFAAPVGGEIVGGSGSIAQHGAETTIVQESERLAVDWQAFDVGKNERVEFVQPGKSAVALNRILGDKGSEILGRIDANGHVILVNLRGVVFGESATVNAGGLIASGLQINPDDFMNGDLVFKRIEGTDGTVINSGMINAASGGNVALVGARVENRGLISATLGSVILASGKETVLTFDESGLLGVQIDKAVLQDELNGSAAVLNAGEIRAENGRILLSASTTRDVFSQAVNWGEQKQARSVAYDDDGGFTLSAGGDVVNSGSINTSGEVGAGKIIVLGENITHSGAIKANANQGRGGNVELHSITTTQLVGEGLVTANAEQGGDIKLLGKNIGLFDQSTVAAIGENGGGRILLGGDREGLNSQVRNADFSYVSEKSNVDVSAAHSGNGGTVIIYAEDTSRVHGSLSAKGGAKAGDGGFIETSGKRGFLSVSTPDVSAANGRSGHWLIDPFDITIVSDGEEINSNGEFTSVLDGSRIGVRSIQTVLNTGGNVTLKTGGDEGDITVSSNITVNPMEDATLNLIAHRDIIFDANIQANGANSLHLHLNANRSGATGGIRFRGARTINTNGGDFSIRHINDDGSINTSMPGSYDVDFSGVTIDLRREYTASERAFYFPGTDNPQNLSRSGSLSVYADHDVTLGNIQISGREKSGEKPKISVQANNDILLDTEWNYDNNPTEHFSDDQINDGNRGYTTTELIAGQDVKISADIGLAYSGEQREEHQDRMHLVLSAGRDIEVSSTIITAGGNFIVRNRDEDGLFVRHVDLSGSTLNTRSAPDDSFGAGSVNIEASGDITVGNLPMFNATEGSLRSPGLRLHAGGNLALGTRNIETRKNNIELAGETIGFNGRLRTYDSGNISVAIGTHYTLPEIRSAGDVTLSSLNENSVFTMTGGSEELSLNGTLTLNLQGGSAELVDVVSTAADDALHLIITSGQNIALQTDQNLSLGNSTISGNLTLTSDEDIRQQDGTLLNVLGLSHFAVGEGSIVLNQEGNIFGSFEEDVFTSSAIWIDGENAGAVEISSEQDLLLGEVDNEMRIGGSLLLKSSEAIAQLGALSVDGGVNLSAPTILLGQENTLTSLSIAEAQSVELRNAQNLELGDIVNTDTLNLSVDGELTQSAGSSLDLQTLTLSGDLTARLTQTNNKISNLSGDILGGDISVSGAMNLNDFIISEVTTISAPDIDIVGQIQLNDEATLTFNDVGIFDFSGGFQGGDAEVNSVSVNGDTNDGIYTIYDTAIWQDVSITLNGGEGVDTLIGPDSDVDWNLGESFELETGPEDNPRVIEFSSMETLQGGSGVDEFRFLNGAMPSLTVIGGGGDDVADYSGSLGDISVSLGDIARLQEIELVRGNNNGLADGNGEFSTNNSELIAEGTSGHTWTIHEVNAGKVVSEDGTTIEFEHFNQLSGGAGVDRFILGADLKGGNARVDGGAGNDIFDMEVDFSGDLFGGEGWDTFNLNAVTTGFLFGESGNDTFVLSTNSKVAALDGGDGQNILLGFDENLIWNIDEGAVVSVADGTNTYVESAINITGLQGSDSNDTFLFNTADARVGIHGGEGVNTANFSGITTDYTVSLGALEELGISHVQTVVGNAAEGVVSTLEIVGDSENTWTLDAANSGTVLRGAEEITFQNFNEFMGGEGRDSFLISASPAGSIDGRGGNDEFFLLAAGLLATLRGGDGEDTLVAYQEAENNWLLSSTNSVLQDATNTTLIQFSGMEELRGAEDYADTFIILNELDAAQKIFAGSGPAVDTIDYSRLTELPINAVLGDAGLTGFESVVGNSNHTLTGANEDNVWELTEAGGSVSWTTQGVNQTTAFSGFGYWVGGSANDTFKLETLNGRPRSIDGAGGEENIVDLSTLANEVHVGLGDASAGLALLNINDVLANPLFANRLTSNAFQAEWFINGANAGTLREDDESEIVFSGFHHLEGGEENIFNLGAAGYFGGDNSVGSITGSVGSILNASSDDAQTWIVSGAGSGSLIRSLSVEETPALTFAGMATLNGGDGADTFILDAAAARVGSINGGAGVNSLLASFTRNNSSLEWLVDDAGGRVAGMVDDFQNIGRLYGHSGTDNFAVTGSAQLALIDSGAGDDEIHLADSSRVDLILAGAGADVIEIFGNASVAEPIDGGEGNDTLDLTELNRAVTWNAVDQNIGGFDYLNIENFNAPANFTNTFQAPDSNNTWNITGLNSGELVTGDGQKVTYQAIANLLGGSLEDVFILHAKGFVSGEIDGGGGNNTLQGDNTDNQWTLSGADAGSILDKVNEFQNIGNLIGGNSNDTFTINAEGVLSGTLDGGAGSDILASERQQQTWTLSGSTAAAITDSNGERFLAFSGVEEVRGSGDDHLIGSEFATAWTIDGPGAGELVITEDELVRAATTITFSGFSRVVGGEGDDDFIIGNEGVLDDHFDGGGGRNSLRIERDGEVAVSLGPVPEGAPDGTLHVERIQTLEVDNGNGNRLYGASQNEAGYSWTISGDKIGTVSPNGVTGATITFINFARLFGGDRSDSFGIAAGGSISSIDGGGGDDFVDRSSHEGDLDIVIGDDLGQGGAFTINSIEGLIGNDNGSPNNPWRATLSARDGTNLWTLGEANAEQDGINDGVFVQGDTRMVFRNFSHLKGGAGDDTFVLKGEGILTGSIVDTTGTNRVDLSGINEARSLQAVLFSGEYVADGRQDTLHLQGINEVIGAGLATTLVGANMSNQWEINGHNEGRVTYAGGETIFREFGHLHGGSRDDTFTIGPNGTLSGWLAGGAGEDTARFNVQLPLLVWLAAASGTGPADGQSWRRLRGDIETLTVTQANPQNRLQLESVDPASWQINGENKGAVAGIQFDGFGELFGGVGNDEFVFGPNGRLTGLVNGGGGENTVDLQELLSPVVVAIGNREGADLRIERIQQLIAKSGDGNFLWGADQDNQWRVDGVNAGALNSLKFSGFANFRGGAADDEFKFQSSGKLSGQIDGGAHDKGDRVDYSSTITRQEIDLREGNSLYNIEELIGNDTTTLYGPHQNAHWIMTSGSDRGELSYGEDQRLKFSGINLLIGGDNVDQFIFANGGVITGGVRGGAGDDRFTITLDRNAYLTTSNWSGGEGEDLLEFVGGGDGWYGTYSGNAIGMAELSFFNPESEREFMVGYGSFESVMVNASLDFMRLRGRSGAADIFRLGPQSWQWDILMPVSYGEGIRALEVDGDNADTILIADSLIAQELILRGGMVEAGSGVVLQARKLVLDNLRGAGSSSSPLLMSVDELALTNNKAPLYMREAEGLTLVEWKNNDFVSLLLLEGDLGQSAAVDSDAAVEFSTMSGAIQLDHRENRMGGGVALEAGAAANLYVTNDLVLAGVDAQDLRLEVGGSITSDAAVVVDNVTRLASGGDIQLTSENNDLNRLSIIAIGNVRIKNSDLLVVDGASINGDFILSANSLAFYGNTSARSLLVDAGVGDVWVDGEIATVGNAIFRGAGLFRNSRNAQIKSGSGMVRIAMSEAIDAKQMIEVESLAEIDPAIFTDVKNYFYREISLRLPWDQVYEEPEEL